MTIRFEWDTEKAQSNLRKHGIDFPFYGSNHRLQPVHFVAVGF
jgi:uncharacterized DUF497 family protein